MRLNTSTLCVGLISVCLFGSVTVCRGQSFLLSQTCRVSLSTVTLAQDKPADGYLVEKNNPKEANADPDAKAKGEAAAKDGEVVKVQRAARANDAAAAARRILAEKRQAEARRNIAAEGAKRAAEGAKVEVLGVLRGVLGREDDAAEQNSVTARLRAVGRKEIFFVHKACTLSAEERTQLNEALEKEIKNVTETKVNVPGGRRDVMVQQREEVVFINGAQVRLPGGSYERIPASVLRAAKEILPSDKKAKLEQEIVQRKQFRNRASVMGAIMGIDREVSLSREQREKLVEVLTSKWDDSWGAPPEILMQNQISTPAIPSRVLQGVLSESQIKIWQGLPKTRVSYNTQVLNINVEMNAEDYSF